MKDGNFTQDMAPTPQLTQGDLDEMMRHPDYWKDGSQVRKQVEEGFKTLYGRG